MEEEKKEIRSEMPEVQPAAPAEQDQAAGKAPEPQAADRPEKMEKPEKTGKKAVSKLGRIFFKTLKIMLYTLIGLLLLLIAAIVTVYVMRDSIISSAIKHVGSKMLDTKVDVKEFKSKPFAGEVHVGDFTIANPKGFNAGNVIEVKNFDVKVDPKSVLSDEIVIEYMELSGVNALAEYDIVENRINMHVLLNNVKRSLGKEPQPLIVINTPSWMKKENILNWFESSPEKPADKSAEAQPAAPEKSAQADAPAESPDQAAAEAENSEAEPEAQAAAKKKILIKKLVLKDIQFTFRSTLFNIEVPVPLLDMTFENLDNVHNAGELTELILTQLLDNILVSVNREAGVEIFQPIQSDLFNKMDKAAEDGQKAANQAIDKYSEKASGYLDKAEKKATEFVGDDKELQKAVKDLRQEGEKLLKDGNVDLKKSVDDLRKLF